MLELQREALDRDASVSDLLRKALVVARKLKLREFEEWASSELDGYKQGSTVPEYRRVHGQVRVHNPYHGWVTMTFEDPEHAAGLTQRLCGTAIAGLENLRGSKKLLVIQFPPEIEAELMKNMYPVALRPDLHVSPSSIVTILDAVRNTALKWTLQLEEDGILGDGLTFSNAEQAQAQAGGYHVMNFYAAVANSQIAPGAVNPTQDNSTSLSMDDVKALLGRIREVAASVDLNENASSELNAELATVDAQLASPRPKTTIIKQSLTSARAILEGAGGNVMGSVLFEIAKVLAS